MSTMMLCKKNVLPRGTPEKLQFIVLRRLALRVYWFRPFQAFGLCMVLRVWWQVWILLQKQVIGHKFGWLTVG
jgi:hypothetical protein